MEEDGAYDVMVIDCPPNLSAACVSAILASDAVIIPYCPTPALPPAWPT